MDLVGEPLGKRVIVIKMFEGYARVNSLNGANRLLLGPTPKLLSVTNQNRSNEEESKEHSD